MQNASWGILPTKGGDRSKKAFLFRPAFSQAAVKIILNNRDLARIRPLSICRHVIQLIGTMRVDEGILRA